MNITSYSSYVTALRRSRWELLTATTLFSIGALVGATQPGVLPADGAIGSTDFTPITFIVYNTRVLFGLWLGAFMFGLPTILGLILNGAILSNGLVTASADPVVTAVLFLPHAIFEIPGILLSGTIGFKTIYSFARFVVRKQDSPLRPADLRDLLRLAILSVGFIVTAGAVEGIVTPLARGLLG